MNWMPDYKHRKRSKQNEKGLTLNYTQFTNLAVYQPYNTTQYICLTNQDLIYPGNLHRLKIPEFQYILNKTVLDLKILLHFSHQKFWEQLKGSKSLRKCLQSCLHMFPRRIFGQYKSFAVNQYAFLQQDQYFLRWQQLIKTVLFIYCRIVWTAKAQQKRWIYSHWIIDIPKIINIVNIYGQSSPVIVKQLIGKIFEQMRQYEHDVDIFLRYEQPPQRHVILVQTINNTQMHKFQQSFLKCILQAMDYCDSLINFIMFFPELQVSKLVTYEGLFLDLISFYFMFNRNIQQQWEIQRSVRVLLRLKIQKTRQRIIKLICLFYEKICHILSKYMLNRIWIGAYKAYIGICRYFVLRQRNNVKQYWENLIKIIILQNPKSSIFISNQTIREIANQQELQILQLCREFERQCICNNQNYGFEQADMLLLKLQEIPHFRDWKMFADSSQLNFIGAQTIVSFDISKDFTQKSVFVELFRNKAEKSMEGIKTEPVAPGYYSYSKQYEDEPDDEELNPPLIINVYQEIFCDRQYQKSEDSQQRYQKPGVDHHNSHLKKKGLLYQAQKNNKFLIMSTSFLQQQNSQQNQKCLRIKNQNFLTFALNFDTRHETEKNQNAKNLNHIEGLTYNSDLQLSF